MALFKFLEVFKFFQLFLKNLLFTLLHENILTSYLLKKCFFLVALENFKKMLPRIYISGNFSEFAEKKYGIFSQKVLYCINEDSHSLMRC